MNKKILGTLLAVLCTQVLASSTIPRDFDKPFNLEIDNMYPEYELPCEEQIMRKNWMEDNDYEEFLYEFQDSDCGTDYKLGDIGIGGGKVFLIDEDGRHGLETSPFQIKNVEYGCFWLHIRDTKEGIWEGKSNTEKAIEAECEPYFENNRIATDELVKIKAGGFSDWYIPSRDELYRIFDVLGEHRVLEKDIADESYPSYFWSSYEAFTNYMSVQSFTTGRKAIAHKSLTLSLLPIRSF